MSVVEKIFCRATILWERVCGKGLIEVHMATLEDWFNRGKCLSASGALDGSSSEPTDATNISRSLLLTRNWTHFESNHSAEQAYSVGVLQVPGTLCQEWLYFCSPKSTASCTTKGLPQKMGRNTGKLGNTVAWYPAQDGPYSKSQTLPLPWDCIRVQTPHFLPHVSINSSFHLNLKCQLCVSVTAKYAKS